MADIQSHQTYTKRMRALEAKYLQGINRAARDTRRRLVLAAERGGISPDLQGDIRLELDELGRQISGLGREMAPEVVSRSAWYFDKQAKMGEAVGATSLPVSPYIDEQEALLRAEVAAGFERAPAVWVDSMRATMLAEAQRLALAEEGQAAATQRLLGMQITDGRASAWRRAYNTLFTGASLGFWGLGNWVLTKYQEGWEQRNGIKYKRQAIAAIDERTTDCCLRVHGQITGTKQPFKLEGTPRFADEVMSPPFHWYCRTSTALYLPEFDEFAIGPTTGQMEEAARLELEAREREGTRVEIHPASATSSRMQPG